MFRAKFVITGVSTHEEGAARSVNMGAVIDDSDENKSFSKLTPSGSLSMYVTNPDLFPDLVQGKEFYLDFTEVTDEATED